MYFDLMDLQPRKNPIWYLVVLNKSITFAPDKESLKQAGGSESGVLW
jgi:hypothetical protein